MKKIMILVVSLLILPSAWGCAEHDVSKHVKNQKIENCKNLTCVRAHIDDVNKEIILLLAKRMEYVKQAGQIKLKNNKTSATDVKRANEVVDNAENIGIKIGLPVGFIRDVFQVIVDKSAHFEQKDMDAKVIKKS